MLWLDTSDPGYPDGRMKMRNAANTAWIDATKASSAIQPDGSRDFTAHQKLANVNPTDPLHAVPKGYADSQIDPLSHIYQLTGGRGAPSGGIFNISSSGARFVTPARDAAKLVRGNFNFNINLATQGPGGRDQAADFIGQWCHAHMIWHPSTGPNAIASASAVAPILPSGYIMSAYGFPLRVGGTANQMFACNYYERKAIYTSGINASLIAGEFNTNTVLSAWAAYVPPNATIGYYAGTMGLYCDTNGNADLTLYMYAAGDALQSMSHPARLIGMGISSANTVGIAGSLRNSGNPVASPSITLGTGTMNAYLWSTGYEFYAPY